MAFARVELVGMGLSRGRMYPGQELDLGGGVVVKVEDDKTVLATNSSDRDVKLALGRGWTLSPAGDIEDTRMHVQRTLALPGGKTEPIQQKSVGLVRRQWQFRGRSRTWIWLNKVIYTEYPDPRY